MKDPQPIDTLLSVALATTSESVSELPITRPYAQVFRTLYNSHGLIVAIHWLAGRLINTAYGSSFSLEREGEFNFPLPYANPSDDITSNPHLAVLPPDINLYPEIGEDISEKEELTT